LFDLQIFPLPVTSTSKIICTSKLMTKSLLCTFYSSID
jgi:hypothetical protein